MRALLTDMNIHEGNTHYNCFGTTLSKSILTVTTLSNVNKHVKTSHNVQYETFREVVFGPNYKYS